MANLEPNGRAEYYHPTSYKDGSISNCKNSGLTFFEDQKDFKKELEYFTRKSERRAANRTERLKRP